MIMSISVLPWPRLSATRREEKIEEWGMLEYCFRVLIVSLTAFLWAIVSGSSLWLVGLEDRSA